MLSNVVSIVENPIRNPTICLKNTLLFESFLHIYKNSFCHSVGHQSTNTVIFSNDFYKKFL